MRSPTLRVSTRSAVTFGCVRTLAVLTATNDSSIGSSEARAVLKSSAGACAGAACGWVAAAVVVGGCAGAEVVVSGVVAAAVAGGVGAAGGFCGVGALVVGGPGAGGGDVRAAPVFF